VIALVVKVEGHIPCGCGHCLAADLPSGKLVADTYVGLGESIEAAREDALQQAYEREPHAELEASVVDSLAVPT
jgi:hypothetical protein